MKKSSFKKFFLALGLTVLSSSGLFYNAHALSLNSNSWKLDIVGVDVSLDKIQAVYGVSERQIKDNPFLVKNDLSKSFETLNLNTPTDLEKVKKMEANLKLQTTSSRLNKEDASVDTLHDDLHLQRSEFVNAGYHYVSPSQQVWHYVNPMNAREDYEYGLSSEDDRIFLFAKNPDGKTYMIFSLNHLQNK